MTYETRIDFFKIALHVADISNPAKPFNISKKWAELITEEFWRQGDIEKKLQMNVEPLFDRTKTKIHDSQIGFISYIVLPVFNIWSGFIPSISHSKKIMQENIKKWKKTGQHSN